MARAKCKMEMMDTKGMCQPSIKMLEGKMERMFLQPQEDLPVSRGLFQLVLPECELGAALDWSKIVYGPRL